MRTSSQVYLYFLVVLLLSVYSSIPLYLMTYRINKNRASPDYSVWQHCRIFWMPHNVSIPSREISVFRGSVAHWVHFSAARSGIFKKIFWMCLKQTPTGFHWFHQSIKTTQSLQFSDTANLNHQPQRTFKPLFSAVLRATLITTLTIELVSISLVCLVSVCWLTVYMKCQHRNVR